MFKQVMEILANDYKININPGGINNPTMVRINFINAYT
jgi:hypothetical protein